MKQILVAITLVLALVTCSIQPVGYAAGETQETLVDLQAKGLRVIEDQSFSVELESWGKVRFVSGKMGNPIAKAYFYLIDEMGIVIYSFPYFSGNSRNYCWKVRAVSFTDVNHDGLTDVVIIAEYATGIGPRGAIPYPVAGIYFQKEKKFINDERLDEQINDAYQNKTIDMVLEYVERIAPKVD